jgi:hypothetical protein
LEGQHDLPCGLHSIRNLSGQVVFSYEQAQATARFASKAYNINALDVKVRDFFAAPDKPDHVFFNRGLIMRYDWHYVP